MRTITRAALAAAALFALVSCASIDRATLQGLGKVAVISIYCDKLIDVDAIPSLAGSVKAWARAEGSDITPALEGLHRDVFRSYAASLPFELAAEEPLLASDAYLGIRDAGIALIPGRQVALPAGYVAVSPESRKNVKDLVARFPEYGGLMFVTVSYALLDRGSFPGYQYARLRAQVTVTVVDRRGRTILKGIEFTEDDSDIKLADVGQLDIPALTTRTIRTTGRASAEMARWLEAQQPA